jgi:hypothetical protein
MAALSHLAMPYVSWPELGPTLSSTAETALVLR